MFSHSMKLILAGTAAVAIASVGCSNKKAETQGSAQVSVQALSLSGDVKSVKIAVSGTGIPTPMTLPLFKQGDGSWSGLVNHIPVGAGNRDFQALAYDAGNAQIYSGSVSGVTINKNQIADVIIVLQEDAANGGFANHAPVIDGLTVSATSVTYGDTVAFTLNAHDQDLLDTLTFTPSPSCGTFGAPTLTGSAGHPYQWKALWTAPTSDASCQINMTVADPKGAKAVAAVTITVGAGADVGGARVATVFESYPVITNITSSADFLTAGGTTQLAVVATMSDNETPSYAWTSDCGAGFDSATKVNPIFTVPSPEAAATCTFTVVVSGPDKVDSKGAHHTLSTTAHLTLNVGQTVVTASAGSVTIDLTSQSLEAANDGATITLYVKARETDPAATISSYTWTATDGTKGAQSDGAGLADSQLVWTAPTPIAPVETVKVTVTDSKGGTASYDFVIRSASNPCAAANSDGVSCNDGDACTTSDVCLAGSCHGTAVVCAALDACHVAGVCTGGA
ncbi:MAG TPA: hypothetical protein VF518_10130, partial [Polyangia bacterium]